MKAFDANGLACVDCADLAWKPSTFAKGLWIKDVAVTDGFEMQILRFDPGTRLPRHAHDCPEFIYILEGELIIGDTRMTAGWASIARVGSVHDDVRSDIGCVVVLVDRPLQE